MELLNATTNPFINIAMNIANNKDGFNKSSFQLIDFLLTYEHFKNFDLNEEFLVRNNSYNNESYSTNFFNTIFNLNHSFNPQLINRLIDAGLKFNPFFKNEKNEVIGDILFTHPELESNRNIFLFKLYLEQYGLADFTEKSVKHNTLHRCISCNQLETAEFLLKHLSVDLTNENLETPIMCAKNKKSLEFLAKYNPSWGQKSVLGNDCSFYFSGFNDDVIKKEMLDFYLQELSKNNTSLNQDNTYVEKRLAETLVQLVSKDATKLELQTFLKKYKIKQVEQLTNKNSRTLGHICAANEDFARFSLFPKTDLYHVDNNGYNIFTSLFAKNRFSSDTKNKGAKTLLLSCFQEPEKNITQATFDRLIKIPFHKYSNDSLPDWILKDHFLRGELLKVLKLSSNDIYFGDYINRNSSLTSSDKQKLYFDLLGNLIKEYEVNILNEEHIFKEIFGTRDYAGGKEHYFEKNSFETFILLLEKCDNVGKISMNDFLNEKLSHFNDVLFDLKNSYLVNNKETFETSHDLVQANHEGFYKNVCMPLFEFLNEHKLFSLIEKVDEDLVNQTLKIDQTGDLNGFLKTFTYLKLNNKLTQKNTKIKNIKI